MEDRFQISLPFDDPVLIFALVMLIILLAPMVFRRMKIPGIVGLILSGTIVGPSVLGLIERDFTIELLGTVGLLYLMFMAGLSIDLNRFEKLRERSIGFGIVSFLLPTLGAYFVGTELFDFSVESSLLLGAIVGSHTLLAYPIAERLGITKNTGVTMSMGGTLVTDTLSLGVLAVIAGTVGDAQGTGYWVGFGSSIAIFIAATILILPRLGRWFFRNVKFENNVDFIFMVAVLFSTAFLADLAGLAPIIGAFMAGLLMNRLVPESGTLMSRIQFVGNVFFIPFFLISVGMLVDIAVLLDLGLWFMAIAFTLLVFTGKGLASLLATRLFKYSRAEGWVIYGLTTPQSAATLAVTLVGYDLGFFGTDVVNAVVVMILFTCLLGPWLVENYGRQVAIEEEEKPYSPADAPQRILVPLANPETSDALMDIAFMVRDEKSGQPIYPLTVARDGKQVEANVARGEKMLSHAVLHAAAADVSVTPVTRVDLNVAKGIARAIEEQRISNVVVGWNGDISTRRKIFGSILDQLLELVDEMVMVCKIEKPVNTFERLVIAIPPFAELEIGFSGTVRSLKLMAEQMGGVVVVLTTGERKKSIMERVEAVKPELEIDWQTLSLWSELPAWLDRNQQENDLFALVSAREGCLSWRPGLDRLPRVISQKYPELSFITIYSSEVLQEAGQGIGYQQGLQILKKDRIKLDVGDSDIETVLEKIITGEPAFEQVEPERVVRNLLENSQDYTPEVMPGVVLFETHASITDEQVFMLGVCRKGIKVKLAANPAHVVLILVTPRFMSVDEHLKTLNKVVKMVKSKEGLEAIKSAQSADEVVKAVMAHSSGKR